MIQYLEIIRDARNVIVSAIHSAATDLHKAEQKTILTIRHYNEGIFNGDLEERRISYYTKPFRFNVAEK